KVGEEETVHNSKINVELDNSFKQSANIYSLENWDSNIVSHPVVQNFITKLEQDLRKSNYDDNKVNEVLFQYKHKLRTDAAKDEDYKKFFDGWWKGQSNYVEFKRYLTSIEGLKYYRTITEQDKDKELDKYYVNQRDAVLADADREWTSDDNVLREKYKPENVEDIVQKYIQESQPDEPYLVIGASFGSGKSSLVKMVSSKYSTD